MAQITEQLIKKMGLHENPKILAKTTELLRLLELRSTNVNATLNEYAKIVLCIDLAAIFLGIEFDQQNALKLSGLRKVQYVNNKRMFEKLLDLNKVVGVDDICIKLGVNEVAKKASELLTLYKNVENESTDFDITHPQYSAMAVYQACKISQNRISKAKILGFSHLRPSQWTQLEQRWDKIVGIHYSKKNDSKIQNPAVKGGVQIEDECQRSAKALKGLKLTEVESYEVWKRRMIAMSHLQLKTGDKENFNKLTT